mmetsp:Transcript_14995/g.44728  ORF Transcript_14995/g.44728 Transcript_14995/m.44728 type:complete len:194 (-) Transcript_14995:18-599(-)
MKRKNVISSSPLVEITLLHRAMRLELESLCELARGLEGAGAGAPALPELRARFRNFDLVFASHSAAEDDVVFPRLASAANRDVAAAAAAEHVDEAQLVDGAAAALDRAAREGVDAETVSAVQSLKEKLTEHMAREEEEIFPLLADVPDGELRRMVGLVLGPRPGPKSKSRTGPAASSEIPKPSCGDESRPGRG